jgi:hypothetical protein
MMVAAGSAAYAATTSVALKPAAKALSVRLFILFSVRVDPGHHRGERHARDERRNRRH